MAAILPSVPLLPKPPGIKTPDTSFNNDLIFSGLNFQSSFFLN